MDLLKFFGLNYHPTVTQYLNSHTKVHFNGGSGTIRKSEDVPFRWQKHLNFSEIRQIEEECEEAIKLWGYLKVYDKHNLSNFYPLTTYHIN